jgi:hypothetical protein
LCRSFVLTVFLACVHGFTANRLLPMTALERLPRDPVFAPLGPSR